MAELTLLDLSFDALATILQSWGIPRFRAEQIWQGVYRDLAATYDDITTLPIALRSALAERLPTTPTDVLAAQSSTDEQTTKLLLRLPDGQSVETVLMQHVKRSTVCVSSQIGCAVGCSICATGRSGFVRNLTAGEIVAQVIEIARILKHRPSNIVYMGMGEPFFNYDAVLASIRLLHDPRGMALGARSFTVSTAGVIPGILRLAEEPLQVNLAVSLHAADDALRTRLVPINRRFPVQDLIEACRTYSRRTHRRITFEVAMIEHVNDTRSHARAVAHLLAGLLCHVNLIPYNPIQGQTWQRSQDERMESFAAELSASGVPVSVRKSRGIKIQAGCGQLRTSENRSQGTT